MMEPGTTTSALASVLVASFRVAEKAFELVAVDTQAKAVLETVNHVSKQLDSARSLRRQKSALFTAFEKSTFDDTFTYTEKAIGQVASLAERVRADMDASGGKVGMNSRMLFVLRDSPNIHVSLTKLSIASQSLNTAIVSMNNRGTTSSVNHLVIGEQATQQPDRAPPTYTEAMFYSEFRTKNLKKRESLMGSMSRCASSTNLAMSKVHPGTGDRSDTDQDSGVMFIARNLGISAHKEQIDEGEIDEDDDDRESSGVMLPVTAPVSTRQPLPQRNCTYRGRARMQKWLEQHSESFGGQTQH